MNTASIIANYIEHNRCLGKRYVTEATILTAFGRSVGDVPLRDIRPAMISQFLDRNGVRRGNRAQEASCSGGLLPFRGYSSSAENIADAEL